MPPKRRVQFADFPTQAFPIPTQDVLIPAQAFPIPAQAFPIPTQAFPNPPQVEPNLAQAVPNSAQDDLSYLNILAIAGTAILFEDPVLKRLTLPQFYKISDRYDVGQQQTHKIVAELPFKDWLVILRLWRGKEFPD